MSASSLAAHAGLTAREQGRVPSSGVMHFYDLHNRIRVASAVPLADLDRFEVGDCRSEPELRVIVGRPARRTPRHDHPG